MTTIAVEECSGANRCIPFPSLSQRGKEAMHALQSPRLRRAGALAIATAITSTTLIAAATPAQAHPAGDRAVSAGSTWLKAQLTDGLVVGQYEEFIYDDFGLSADVAFALDAVGGQGSTVEAIADAVAPKVTQWYDSYGTVYTGSAAKAIALAQIAGADATDFGGQDLQTVVEEHVAMDAPIVGRAQNEGETDYQPPYSPIDSLNVISQSWAARGLAGQDSVLADETMSFLLDQQCNAGFFRASLTADKTNHQQGCVDGTDKGSIDTTALAVINILDTPGASTRAKGAAALAATWLKGQQATDGSFTAGGAEGYNANTTGLAGWALAEAGHDGAATRAATWLRGLQVADLAPCTTTLTLENGAIAYKAEDLVSARTAGGIVPTAEDRFRRASAQALPALAYVPEGAGALGLSAPTTAVEKSAVTVSVTGLGAGEAGCVSFGSQAKPVTGTGGAVDVTFTLPAGAATHTFRLTTLAGSSTAIAAATVTPVPAPSPVPQVGTLDVPRVVKVEGRKFTVLLTCEGEVACAGKVKVKTARKVELRSGKRLLTLAKRSYSLTPGGEKELVLTLTKPGRKLLSDGKVKVKAVQTVPGAERSVTKFWLKAARG